MKGLEGKNAIVTGGGAGIGRAIVTALAKEGTNIVVCDIKGDLAVKAADEVKAEFGVRAIGLEADISKVEGHKDLVAKIEKEFGQIDILVNNAGVSFTGNVLEMTPKTWDLVHSINIRGTFFLTQAVYEKMLERKVGRIINIASMSGERPADRSDVAYCTSKAGVIQMTRVFAKAADGTAITVNSIAPGLIATELAKRIGLESALTPGKVPLERFGTPEEIADGVVFLASDMASYISGQCLRINGGQFML